MVLHYIIITEAGDNMTTHSNEKFLSIPPFISTSWKNVRSLQLQDTHLVISLTDGSSVVVPNLDQEAMESVFAAHAGYLAGDEATPKPESRPAPGAPRMPPPAAANPFGGALPFPLTGGPESLMQAMHHDQNQSELPDLPHEILEKVAAITKVLAPKDSGELPKPEPHCNCLHCQIARAIQHGADEEEETVDCGQSDDSTDTEEVTDDDLAFREWDIVEIGEQIYQVSNPLDDDESYKVCLAEPVGCTCGSKNCEHLLAVLRS